VLYNRREHGDGSLFSSLYRKMIYIPVLSAEVIFIGSVSRVLFERAHVHIL